MSNEGLKSEVRRLQSQLYEVEAINRELNNELWIISSGVSRGYNTLENFNSNIQNTLQDSDNMIHRSHKTIIDAYELQGEIERRYRLFKNIELANKKIRAANNRKYYEFVNYRTVRKIVRGLMDNFDVNLVSDKTIFKSVEKQHLQVPDYWLTCALLSIMAWKNDDRELAERAMARALLLDKKHSAIFYMLFNLRLDRDEAALKWFIVYQECDQLGSDQRTFLMLFSLINKKFREKAADNISAKISAYIDSVVLSSAKAAGYSEDNIIAQINGKYSEMKPKEEPRYASLKKYFASFDNFNDNMMLAKNNINILEYILKIINVTEEQKNAFIKNYIDELIAIPNQAEEAVYDEIAYNELIIKLGGDVGEAKSRFDAEQRRAKTQINIISEIVGWIFERDNQEINGQMRLNMFTLVKDLQEKSVKQYAENYRRNKKTTAEIRINDYAATVDFRKEQDEIIKIETHYANIKNNLLSTIKSWPAIVSFILSALALAGGIASGFYILFAGTAIGALYGVYNLITNNSKKKQYELDCGNSTRNAVEILQRLFAEFRQYQAEFNEYDSYNDKIIDELKKI